MIHDASIEGATKSVRDTRNSPYPYETGDATAAADDPPGPTEVIEHVYDLPASTESVALVTVASTAVVTALVPGDAQDTANSVIAELPLGVFHETSMLGEQFDVAAATGLVGAVGGGV